MCGIFGAISAKPDPRLPEWVFFGLSQLQHRGQESAGVAYSDGDSVYVEKSEGLVSHVLTDNKIKEIQEREPKLMIGQTRYSTSKGTSSRNIQPQWLDTLRGKLALVHNGNIPNLEEKKAELMRISSGQVDISKNANDTEFMLKKIFFLMTRNGGNVIEAVKEFMATTTGSYSAALLNKRAVYLFRDPWGNRPLFLGSSKDVFLFGSETCALKDHCSQVVHVDPGQVVKIEPEYYNGIGWTGVFGKEIPKETPAAHCLFEKIYFARPDSNTFGEEEEGSFRFRLGQKLAQLFPVPSADFVSCIPESGRPSAEGFAFESHLPTLEIYTRNPFILGRTFIIPNPGDRAAYSKKKYHLMKWVLEYAKNKSIVLVDDSIVRGNTMKGKIAQLMKAGAKEVHLRISSPPVIGQCFYGLDLPTKEELVASSRSEEEVRQWLGATSLKYLPINAIDEVLKEGKDDPKDFCKGCFTGEYPIPFS